MLKVKHKKHNKKVNIYTFFFFLKKKQTIKTSIKKLTQINNKTIRI